MILHPVGILSNRSQIKLEQYGPKTQEHRPISCNHSVLSHVNLYQSSQALPSQSSKQKPVVYLQRFTVKNQLHQLTTKLKPWHLEEGRFLYTNKGIFIMKIPLSNPQESHPNNRIKDHGFSWIFTAAKTWRPVDRPGRTSCSCRLARSLTWSPGVATQKWGQKHGIKTTNGSFFFLNGANKQKVEGFCHDTCLAGLPSNFWGIKHSLDTGLGPIFWCPMHRHRHRICFHFRCAIRSPVFHRTSSSS